MSTQSSTIFRRLRNYCNILSVEPRLSVVGDVSYRDDIESAVDAGLARAGRLRHIILVEGESPSGESVLRSAFEGKL